MLQVVGAGFGRTGTLSLKSALEILGYGPCYHMENVFARPWHARAWRLAYQGRFSSWERLLNGYGSIVDWPGCSFYIELIERWPEAKVILTVRDPQPWYESVAATIYPVMRRFPLNRVGQSLPVVGEIARMLESIIWRGTFDGRFTDRRHAIEVYNCHNRKVINTIPSDQLLVFDVASGWEPLCAFLGAVVPAGLPFPHANDRGAYWQRVRHLMTAAYLGMAAAGFITWRLARQLRRPAA